MKFASLPFTMMSLVPLLSLLPSLLLCPLIEVLISSLLLEVVAGGKRMLHFLGDLSLKARMKSLLTANLSVRFVMRQVTLLLIVIIGWIWHIKAGIMLTTVCHAYHNRCFEWAVGSLTLVLLIMWPLMLYLWLPILIMVDLTGVWLVMVQVWKYHILVLFSYHLILLTSVLRLLCMCLKFLELYYPLLNLSRTIIVPLNFILLTLLLRISNPRPSYTIGNSNDGLSTSPANKDIQCLLYPISSCPPLQALFSRPVASTLWTSGCWCVKKYNGDYASASKVAFFCQSCQLAKNRRLPFMSSSSF